MLIKMGFIETYSKARICHYIKHLSILSIPVTIPFKLASHCDVRNVHENQAAFKMNGALTDFTLCWYNTKKQTRKVSLIASKEVGLDVNDDKTNYVFMK